MTRRASLPGAEELFRSTPKTEEEIAPESRESVNVQVDEAPSLQVAKEADSKDSTGPRHDEKVTFYCTAEELTRLERARFTLRAEHRIPTDRGRLIRAALADFLGDFEEEGERSRLVRDLRQDR